MIVNRNVESHFAQLPQVDIKRSRFDRSFGHKTSFNIGELIPFYCDEVLPGDTFDVQTSTVVRLQTLLTPIMDNIYLDTYYFYVPCRILWMHWKEFMGENTQSAWYDVPQYSVPQLKMPTTGWNVGTIADYLGVPTEVANTNDTITVSALPFRAYAMICDQWFRDNNVTDPLYIPTGDATETGTNGSNYRTDVVAGGKPFLASKYHDYFSSCLPSPQRGPITSIFGAMPSVDGNPARPGQNLQTMVPVNTGIDRPTATWPQVGTDPLLGYRKEFSDTNKYSFADHLASGGNHLARWENSANPNNFIPTNLWADMSGMNITINELRIAFQVQKFRERAARGGSRYREMIKAHFNVTSPDARQQIPEYLGGHRFPLSIHQVANTSQGENDFLGDLGAMSNTADVHSDFVKSFTEHGYIIGLCVARYDHSYPQGLEKMFTRKSMFDYYFPVFANIGESPVKKNEIYLQEGNTDVFGYNEAWADYRFKFNRVSAEMRPGVTNSLAFWHLADYYSQAPTLSDGWIREDKSNVDRVLAVTSQLSNQVFADFYVKNIATRPMPMYSIPGLIDHN